MKEMFEASVDGEAYDAERFGQYFRPAGMSAKTGDPNKASSNGTATSRSPAPVVAPTPPTAEAAPFAADVAVAEAAIAAPAAAPAAPAEGNAHDILAMIRSRQSS